MVNTTGFCVSGFWLNKIWLIAVACKKIQLENCCPNCKLPRLQFVFYNQKWVIWPLICLNALTNTNANDLQSSTNFEVYINCSKTLNLTLTLMLHYCCHWKCNVCCGSQQIMHAKCYLLKLATKNKKKKHSPKQSFMLMLSVAAARGILNKIFKNLNTHWLASLLPFLFMWLSSVSHHHHLQSITPKPSSSLNLPQLSQASQILNLLQKQISTIIIMA